MNNDLGLEDEFVSDRLGTTHRAIDVFRTGEFQGTHNERLRIIKLLKEAQQSKPCQCDDCGDHIWDKAIALIKEGQE